MTSELFRSCQKEETVKTIAALLSSGWIFLISFMAFLLYVGLAKPGWFSRLMRALGSREGCDSPFYYFKSWTWRRPPDNWKGKIWQCLFCMLAFASLAVYLILTKPDPKPWPFIAVPALMSIHFLLFALRIGIRATTVSQRTTGQQAESAD